MIESVKNVFAVSELRNRVLFTLGLLAVYRSAARSRPRASTGRR